ncbi:MAG: 2-octaprenyl-3-methyl-6-methoxy-1,4-benzoquinol hydroxylase [Gammaproteobacteria bacterium]|nr:MAG: 2-octaprenyl-3-methyl-6-methoxy-1,4-benzoquinol hydroxylase [Gammaproteobacteria bacterium]
MTSEHFSVDVVITGAGMVGLTLANLLSKQGKSIAIIDRSEVAAFKDQQKYQSRVTAVSPGSQAIFKYLNAWPAMQAKRVSPFQHMHVWDEAGGSQENGGVHFNANDMDRNNLGHIVENFVIQSSLNEVLRQQENVEWFLPEHISKVITFQDHAEVELDSGTVISAKLVVGADGGRSTVRNLAEIAYTEKSYQQIGLVALVQTEQPHENTAWQRFLSTGPLALLPLDNGQCSIVWSVSGDYADELMKLNEHEFAEALTQASDRQLGSITLKSKCAAFPLVSGQAESMVQPRIALVGDAAHALHPLAGQGANLGFTDAAVLADVLEQTERDIGSLKVLRKYERARVGETQIMQSAMDAFVAAFGSSNSTVVTARNAALRSADSIQPVKKFFMKHAMGLSKDRPTYAR